MEKPELLEKVKQNKYTNEQLISWISCLPNISSRKPVTCKKGDVFMHPIFHHPYVLLDKKDKNWLCCLMTTEVTTPCLVGECKSRFFKESYFTSTMFMIDIPVGSFMNVYDNNKHLKEIETKLKILYI